MRGVTWILISIKHSFFNKLSFFISQQTQTMEWPEYLHPYSETFFLNMDKPSPGWTYQENKLFETALSEIDPASPAFFQHLASRVPWKPIDEIKTHYQSLVHDLNMIETGLFPDVLYKKQADEMEVDTNREYGSPSNEARPRNGQQRRRGVPWTEEEHQLFLMGLNKYGKGDWRSISRYYVITKTPTQVASHAQKYFRRQTSSTPVDRRRPSIHDIQTVNPTALTALPQPQIDCDEFSINPVFHNNFNGGGIIEQSTMFPPMSNSVFLSDDPVLDQASAGSYLLPSLVNQQWC